MDDSVLSHNPEESALEANGEELSVGTDRE
jgi:hypothetical protein